MPVHRELNHDFFKKWTPEMAYVLGFFTADGNMIRNKRGAHFMEFYVTDREIIIKIRRLLGSSHKIAIRDRRRENPNCKIGYRLQIGSKAIFNDLSKLGFTPNKSKTIKFPKVPNIYLSNFVRGYFDGDGHVSVCTYQRRDRKNPTNLIFTGFTSGSHEFLKELMMLLRKTADTKGGALTFNKGYRLNYSVHDSYRLYNFMYAGLSGDLFLERKKCKFEYYFKNLWTGISIG